MLGVGFCLRRPHFFQQRQGTFRPRRGSLLLSAAKVTKNAVQTCGLKIRPRPAHGDLPFCIPRERGGSLLLAGKPASGAA